MLVSSICSFSHNFLRVKIKPFPNAKFLDMTKLKAFAEDKLTLYDTILSFNDPEIGGF